MFPHFTLVIIVGETQRVLSSYLAPHHMEALKTGSRISEDVIEARGYWTAEDPDELIDLGFAEAQRRAPALVIPVRGVDGEIRFSRIRPDNPRTDPKNPKKIIKYEQPANVDVALDIPLPALEGLKDLYRTLWIVEGEKKADALVSQGEVAIALLGVWNWKKDGWLLPDWEHIPLIGREVNIAFDSDTVSKYEVRQAENALARALEGRTGYVG